MGLQDWLCRGDIKFELPWIDTGGFQKSHKMDTFIGSQIVGAYIRLFGETGADMPTASGPIFRPQGALDYEARI
jgi:hypothetical protein